MSPEGGDFDVTVKVRNGRFLGALRQAGYRSVLGFCKQHGLNQSVVNEFSTMTRSPLLATGEPSPLAQNVADILGVAIDDLFPPRFMAACLARASRVNVRDLTEDQVNMLMRNVPQTPEEVMLLTDARRGIDKALGSLPPRHERVLRLRYALGGMKQEKTLAETADDHRVTRERIRQIERAGLTRLRAPHRLRELAEAAVTLGVINEFRALRYDRALLPRQQQQAAAGIRSKEPEPKPVYAYPQPEPEAKRLKRRVRFPVQYSSPPPSKPPPLEVYEARHSTRDTPVDLRDVLGMEAKDPVVAYFHEKLIYKLPDERYTVFMPGNYIVPRLTLANVPTSHAQILYDWTP